MTLEHIGGSLIDFEMPARFFRGTCMEDNKRQASDDASSECSSSSHCDIDTLTACTNENAASECTETEGYSTDSEIQIQRLSYSRHKPASRTGESQSSEGESDKERFESESADDFDNISGHDDDNDNFDLSLTGDHFQNLIWEQNLICPYTPSCRRTQKLSQVTQEPCDIGWHLTMPKAFSSTNSVWHRSCANSIADLTNFPKWKKGTETVGTQTDERIRRSTSELEMKLANGFTYPKMILQNESPKRSTAAKQISISHEAKKSAHKIGDISHRKRNKNREHSTDGEMDHHAECDLVLTELISYDSGSPCNVYNSSRTSREIIETADPSINTPNLRSSSTEDNIDRLRRAHHSKVGRSPHNRNLGSIDFNAYRYKSGRRTGGRDRPTGNEDERRPSQIFFNRDLESAPSHLTELDITHSKQRSSFRKEKITKAVVPSLNKFCQRNSGCGHVSLPLKFGDHRGIQTCRENNFENLDDDLVQEDTRHCLVQGLNKPTRPETVKSMQAQVYLTKGPPLARCSKTKCCSKFATRELPVEAGEHTLSHDALKWIEKEQRAIQRSTLNTKDEHKKFSHSSSEVENIGSSPVYKLSHPVFHHEHLLPDSARNQYRDRKRPDQSDNHRPNNVSHTHYHRVIIRRF